MIDISTERFDSKILAQEGEQVSVWKVRPFQLVSLLEMLEHNANLFYLTTRNLYEFQITIEREIKERGGMATLTDSEIGFTNSIIDAIRRACLPIQLDSVLHRLSRFNNVHFQALRGAPFNLEQLRVELDSLVEEIASALSRNKFLMIPDNQAGYYGNPELFGSEVAARFPEANKEITEAGNCYATGNYTACIFHLMRAVEYGARALVVRLKIKRGNGKDELPHPVELCDWGTIYGRLHAAVNKLPSRTSVRASDTRAFYSHAVAQFGNFKDAWRNKISHTRVNYRDRPHLIVDVMENTRQFMQHLAERVKEPKERSK